MITAGAGILFLATVTFDSVGASGQVAKTASSKSAASPVHATTPDLEDRFGDGTPNFLRLDSASDQEAFRRWFALIAEFQALRPKGDVPAEINDCAALLRYSYRNALREHNDAWGRENQTAPPRPLPEIKKYHYPFTPLRAAFFRVRPGPFNPEDLQNGAFAEFADVKTLKGFNAYLVSRDVSAARPGDLLFYRQLEQDASFHSMVFIGHSQWTSESGHSSANEFVVYHTGPIGKEPGEMRMMRLADLLNHPSPKWRPLPGNSNFLGVYRWNILRETN